MGFIAVTGAGPRLTTDSTTSGDLSRWLCNARFVPSPNVVISVDWSRTSSSIDVPERWQPKTKRAWRASGGRSDHCFATTKCFLARESLLLNAGSADAGFRINLAIRVFWVVVGPDKVMTSVSGESRCLPNRTVAVSSSTGARSNKATLYYAIMVWV